MRHMYIPIIIIQQVPTCSYSLVSTDTSYNDPQYHDRECNYHLTQCPPQPSFHQQESTTPSTKHQEHGDDAQESYEGEESFEHDMNAFFEYFHDEITEAIQC